MIVSNTTPISNLLHLGRLSILFSIFGTIHIPDAVASELSTVFSTCKEWLMCLKQRQVIITSVTNKSLVKQMMPMLHHGEAEAICLSMEQKARLCLIDDKDARAVAELNNILVTGTLGILIKAKNLGLIPSIRQLADILREQHHFWIAQDMYEAVLTKAGESS